MRKSPLIGKTIKKVEYYGLKGYDDNPYIKLTFADGDFVFIEGGYGGYTGESEDEYKVYINALDINTEPTDVVGKVRLIERR